MNKVASVLDPANDPAAAHAGVDWMCNDEFKDLPLSVFVIGHAPGKIPQMKYYGRTLTETEMRGVLMTILMQVGQ